MAGVSIPDDILRNILSRLPAKPMGWCRCVSTHWNRLISDPSFMMSRSSIIFLSGCESSISIHILEESSGLVTNLDFSMFKIPTIKNRDDRFVKIVGTFSGIILLAVKDYIGWDSKLNSYMEERMILYNPITGVYEIFHDPYSSVPGGAHAYGFGYGATPGELKMIRFRNFNHSKRSWDTCDVFNLKTRSWSQPELNIQDAHFIDEVGMFLKGYLYWMCRSKIVALNVEKIVFSEIELPADSTINKDNHLGTCHGCLWMITSTIKTFNFDVWVMNEQGVDNSWSKACSLTLGLEPQWDRYSYRIIKITEDGRIKIFIITNDYEQMIKYKQTIIYDTSKHSYKFLKSSSRSEALSEELSEELSNFHTSIKYKESLISTMDICRV